MEEVLEVRPAKKGDDDAMTPEQMLTRATELLAEASEPVHYMEIEGILNFLLSHDALNPYLLFYYATSQMKQNRLAIAEHLYQRCVDIKPDFAEAWNNMGYVKDRSNRKEEAQECFNKALELQPESAEFMNNLATVFVNAGSPEEAIRHCDRAIELNPESVDAHWNRGLALLELRRYEEGFAEYEWGLKENGGKRKQRDYTRADEGSTPHWTPDMKDATVIVYGEQGVGDEVMFASCIPDLQKQATVILDVHPRLVHIFRRSFPDAHVYGTRKEQVLFWPQYEEWNAKLAIGSLGKHFRRTEEDFPRTPYLKPDPALVEKWRARLDALGPKPKIGFSWKGGTIETRKDLRSIALDHWGPIFGAIDAEWISMQYTDGADEMCKMAADRYNVPIHHWQRMVDDLDESYAGVLPNLDLVISVNTSLIHAAGAFGAPCWCLTPSRPAWRYAIRGPMPWYGSVKMYRQRDKDDGWTTVIKKVEGDLKKWGARREAA